MIKNLIGSVRFPGGETIYVSFQPQTGITAVVGGNGSGKTFTGIEAPRFLLYGKAALRGAASDYKEIDLTGTFTIRGHEYEIHRSGKREWIKDQNGDTLAVGAAAVTEAVIELMGYGLDVFDLVNCAPQKKADALGDMRASERKAKVDAVLGVGDTIAVEKACREEATGYRREVEALTKTLRAPGDEPVNPHPDVNADQLRASIAEDRRIRAEFETLKARRREIERPVLPVLCQFSEDSIAELEAYVDAQRALHDRHRTLHVAAAGCSWKPSELDAAEERFRVRKAYQARGPAPTLTREEIARGFDQHAVFNAHTASDEVECPSCHTRFRPTGDAPATPDWSIDELREQDNRQRRWMGETEKPLPAGLDLTEQQIASGRRALAAAAELQELEPLGPDKSGELKQQREAQAAMSAFAMAQLNYERVQQANADVDAAIAALGTVAPQQTIDGAVDRLREIEVYEASLRAHEREVVEFARVTAVIADKQRLADEFKKGALGLADARAVLKSLIAPRISRIASALVRDMTMGKLSSVIVDDEMEVSVDGKRLEVLSGAGKTVANVALRIAMGQALVAHNFPVFLADEIDGDFDDQRRQATLAAMTGLKKHLAQLILITHRGAEVADHVHSVETTM